MSAHLFVRPDDVVCSNYSAALCCGGTQDMHGDFPPWFTTCIAPDPSIRHCDHTVVCGDQCE